MDQLKDKSPLSPDRRPALPEIARTLAVEGAKVIVIKRNQRSSTTQSVIAPLGACRRHCDPTTEEGASVLPVWHQKSISANNPAS